MRVRIVLLILAIFFGIAAVIGVMVYINNVKSTIVSEEELFPVVIAVSDIAKDTKVSDMIVGKLAEVKDVPKKYLVENALGSLDEYKDFITIVQVSKGEQITSKKLGRTEDIRIAFTVPDGCIAVSVPYDEIHGVSNLITAGDKVNVIVTLSPTKDQLVLFNKDIVTQSLLNINETESSSEQTPTGPSTSWFPTEQVLDEDNYIVYPQTKLLLWNVQVLYVGSKIVNPAAEDEDSGMISGDSSNNAPKEIKTVTLAVTPDQAEKIVFSEELGRVWLALVPADGIEEKETPGRTFINIMDK
jgi:pilus assembly protein CpaB